jgi:hypothetical protein
VHTRADQRAPSPEISTRTKFTADRDFCARGGDQNASGLSNDARARSLAISHAGLHADSRAAIEGRPPPAALASNGNSAVKKTKTDGIHQLRDIDNQPFDGDCQPRGVFD